MYLVFIYLVSSFLLDGIYFLVTWPKENREKETKENKTPHYKRGNWTPRASATASNRLFIP